MKKKRNNPLFTVSRPTIVDMNTGEEVPTEGPGLQMLPGPPGSCQWCHVKHDPGQPHNRDSLPYQIKFQTLKGRAPTWSDAMEHCSDDVKALWRNGLVEKMKAHGLEIPADLKDEE